MTEIIFRKTEASPGMTRVDVLATGMPDNFLGLGADLDLEGAISGDGVVGVEWGKQINQLPEQQRPIKMVKYLPEQNRLVLGITYKSNNLPKTGDGVLFTLVFRGEPVILKSLHNTVFSIYDGTRWDRSEVVWKTEGMGKTPEVSAKTEKSGLTATGQKLTTGVEMAKERENQTVSGTLADDGDPVLANILNNLDFSDAGGFRWEGIWPAIPLIILVLAAFFHIRGKQMGKRAGRAVWPPLPEADQA
jgi:hypothetical protein